MTRRRRELAAYGLANGAYQPIAQAALDGSLPIVATNLSKPRDRAPCAATA